MGLLSAVFLVNLVCSIIPWQPCDLSLPEPEIIRKESSMSLDSGGELEGTRKLDGAHLNLHRRLVEQPGQGRSFQGILQTLLGDVMSGVGLGDFSPRSLDLNFAFEEGPIVETSGGLVEGFPMTSMEGRQIYAFEGIFYGESTAGYNRFRPPIPKQPWEGIYKADKKIFCLQMHYAKLFRVVGTEDCLVVNVYTNSETFLNKESNQNSSQLLPVIAFIHGGSFVFGAGFEYGPSYLMNKDVVFVSMNYRVGILGFLSTGDSEASGNWGLKDQQLALKWISENIQAFGGDPQRVSLIGQSAGSVSSHLHLLSNRSAQYFQSGASMSGSAFCHWGIISKSRILSFAHKMATLVRCPTEPSAKLVECLRATNPSMLVGAQIQLPEWQPFPAVIYGPVIEEDHEGAFFTATPETLYREGRVPRIPWIFSITSQEGYVGLYGLYLFRKIRKLKKDMDQYLPLYLDYKYLRGDDFEISEKIQRFYGQNSINFDDNTIADIGADRYFHVGVKRAINFHSEIAPTYAYIFDFLSQYNAGGFFRIPKEKWGVGHGEDIFFFFNASQYSQGFKASDPEYKLSQIMNNILINFADKKGPLYEDEEGVLQRIWHPVSFGSIKYLNFGEEIKMIEDPFEERTLFWENLGVTDFPQIDYRLNYNSSNL